ncbi:Hypothetical protein CINCED_3A010625 [Cinara cedri]|uniref:MSL3 chromodomain-like domain-containing protein n=2 Tax=Cinara cedri TaxID=506608 RepID=A0A5E4N6K9_9HEMI|nr:Hypothetical protein CINCED_3A010625 [Cinara cedri]
MVAIFLVVSCSSLLRFLFCTAHYLVVAIGKRFKMEVDETRNDNKKFMFNEGERLFVYYKKEIYEGMCKETRWSIDNSQPEFLIHYIGWKNKWDEWMDEDQLLKWTDVNYIYYRRAKAARMKYSKESKNFNYLISKKRKQVERKKGKVDMNQKKPGKIPVKIQMKKPKKNEQEKTLEENKKNQNNIEKKMILKKKEEKKEKNKTLEKEPKNEMHSQHEMEDDKQETLEKQPEKKISLLFSSLASQQEKEGKKQDLSKINFHNDSKILNVPRSILNLDQGSMDLQWTRKPLTTEHEEFKKFKKFTNPSIELGSFKYEPPTAVMLDKNSPFSVNYLPFGKLVKKKKYE